MRRKITIETIKNEAKKKGGICLSKKYTNARTKIKYQCKLGHKWTAAAASLLYNKAWCPVCSKNVPPKILEIRKIAKDRGGKLLSKTYIDAKSKLDFKCSQGHTFSVVWNNIKSGRWCSICAAGRGERIVKFFFEEAFQTEFVKTRPTWLLNSRGNRLELDGYSEKLKIAFEHHGEQHYRYVERYHKDKDSFDIRQEDDNRKIVLARENGINLVIVPSVPTMLAIDELAEFLNNEFIKIGINPRVSFHKIKVPENVIFDLNEKYRPLKEIIEAKGGILVTKSLLSKGRRLEIKCKNGHVFYPHPSSVIKGKWCSYCLPKKKVIGDNTGANKSLVANAFKRLKEAVKKNNGVILDEAFSGRHKALLFQCQLGHQFKLSPNAIYNGTWCQLCKQISKDIEILEEIQTIVAKKSGTVLDLKIPKATTRCQVKCKAGHLFRVSLVSLKKGQWCKECSYIKLRTSYKHTIDELKSIARKKKGICLSSEYEGVLKKYEFKCKNGHTFFVTAADIFNGNWCGDCYRKRLK